MIVRLTAMTKMPENCIECTLLCRLPEYKNGDKILAKYQEKRHENCPLREIKEVIK